MKAEEFTSWTEAAVHTEGRARLAALGVAAGLRTGGAALAVLHVEGARFCCSKHSPGQKQRLRNKQGKDAAALFTTQLGGPPGPRPPPRMSALMGVLGYGGTHGQEVGGVAAAAAARVFDTDVHEGVEVHQFLTVEDGGSQQYVLTEAFL